MELMTT
jgi:hypothetical protein